MRCKTIKGKSIIKRIECLLIKLFNPSYIIAEAGAGTLPEALATTKFNILSF